MFGHMVHSFLSPKFGVTSFDGMRENDIYGRTTETRGMTVALLCSSTKQGL